MDAQNLFAELQNLRQQIHFHNYRYHVLDSPVVSDYEYDQLLNRLKQIEAEHPEWVTSDSPTQRVGTQVSDRFVKLQHPAPVLSLSNAFDTGDVLSWYERILKLDRRVSSSGFVLEPKIDGLTVILHYRDGVFTQGATRGDGEIGEDITANLRTILSIPMRIPVNPDCPAPPEYLVVRGEVFMNIKDFERLNKSLEEAGERVYVNPRNTAAGSLRQLNPRITAKRPLLCLAYAMLYHEQGSIPTTQWETLAYLKALGFPVSERSQYCQGISQVVSASEEWIKSRDDFPHEVDGVVIKLNDLSLAESLGVVGKDPRGALALKYAAREVTTLLNDIGVNVGRTGVLTPYAMLEPVEIGGVIVKQATLHNFDFIREKDIRIGDRVLVKRAGDVIPYVIGPVKEARSGSEEPFEPPLVCPVCQQPVDHIKDEVAWYCVNAACPAQLIRNVEHFVSRSAMDIVGLGIKIVEQLEKSGLIKDVADIYRLNVEDLLSLEGFAEKKAQNIVEAINTSRKRPLGRLINALGIHGVGEVMALELTRYFRDMDELGNASKEMLENIEGIGPNIAESITDWFQNDANQKIIKKLRESGVWPVAVIMENAGQTSQPLAGMTFVITGTLPNYGRDEIKAIIQDNGGKVSSSVSKSTSYLIVGEEPGSKLDKARLFNVPQIDEDNLLAMIKKG